MTKAKMGPMTVTRVSHRGIRLYEVRCDGVDAVVTVGSAREAINRMTVALALSTWLHPGTPFNANAPTYAS